MKVMLKTAVKKLTNKKCKKLKDYLSRILKESSNENTWLKEGETVKILYKSLIIYFSWEWICAHNPYLNDSIDLTSVDTKEEEEEAIIFLEPY